MKFTLNNGQTFETHNDHIGRKMHNTRDYYERVLLNEIGRFVKGGTFLDIGANIGNHSVYFAKYTASKVISFEPNVKNYRLLDRNVRGLNVTPILAGCSNRSGKAGISDVPDNMGMCELTEGETVTVIRVDELIHEPVNLIKIDAERSTKDALEGCSELIRRYKPVIVIEGVTEINGYRSVWSGCATRTDIFIPV